MSKTIVISSDSTGQAGGITFDEVRTNVYKAVPRLSDRAGLVVLFDTTGKYRPANMYEHVDFVQYYVTQTIKTLSPLTRLKRWRTTSRQSGKKLEPRKRTPKVPTRVASRNATTDARVH